VAQTQTAVYAFDSGAIDEYIYGVCPSADWLFGDDSGRYVDTNVKADVSTLGKEIATYYVDHIDPDPVITIQDGVYYLLDDPIGNVYVGNKVTDQYYNSPSDWCVEVTNDRGNLKTFNYSAQDGLWDGTCR
jgi:type IV pilus assembly protein PilA